MNDTCKNLREALLDRADGRATPARLAAVEEHLAACAACRAAAAALGAPFAFGAVEVPAPVIDQMRADLHRRLDALEPQPAPGLLAWLFSGSVAIPKPFAWAAVTVALMLWSSSAPRPAQTPSHAPPPPVLMEGVDRLTLQDDVAQS